MKTKFKTHVGIAIAILFSTHSLCGQSTDFWQNTINGFYHQSSSWQDGSPAGINDHAVFDLSNSVYTALWSTTTGNTTSRSILVQNGGVRFQQTIAPPVLTHTVLDDLIVESGSLTVSRHILAIQENLEVSGEFEAENTAVLNIFDNLFGSPNSGDVSSITVSGSDTEINVGGSAVIGQFGSSDINVSDQAKLDVEGNFRIAFNGSAFALFENAGTILEVGGGPFGQTIVGGNGVLGVLDFFSGATGTTESLIVTSNGIVDIVNPGSVLTADETLISGSTGPVAINIVDGGVLDSGNVETTIADNPGTTGNVSVGDPGSLWMIDGILDVGQFGAGELQVTNGGQVTSMGTARLGVESIGSGLVSVSGSGSTWTTSGPFDVGQSGTGELNVTSGGLVSSLSGVSRIGRQTGSSGIVTVSGTDSMLDIRNLDVGLFGDGEMHILSGANVFSLDGFIGLSTGAGLVEVSGLGAQWDTGTIQIGDTLEISLGGVVNGVFLNFINGGVATVEGTDSALNAADEMIINSGELRIDQGSVHVSESMVINDSSTVRMESIGARLQVGNVLNNQGMMDVSGSAAEIQGDVFNNGDITKSGSGGLSVIGDLTHFEPATINIADGNSIAVHGEFTSDTTVSGLGAMFVLGSFKPGDGIGSTTFEGDVQLRPTSTTEIEIGGIEAPDHDFFVVEGSLSIQAGAQLSILFVNGFVPQAGDAYFIAAPETLAGTFDGLPEGASLGVFDDVELTISYTAFDGNDIWLFASATTLIGDVNLDGAVNLLDVAPFVALISSGMFQAEADINQDGVVNLLDVAGFVDLLSGV